jgi:hypothetical protein
MSTKYPEEFKASIIARMLPPENANVPELAVENKNSVPQARRDGFEKRNTGHPV